MTELKIYSQIKTVLISVFLGGWVIFPKKPPVIIASNSLASIFAPFTNFQNNYMVPGIL